MNRRLIELASRIAREAGAEVDEADFGDFDIPLYDGDLQAEAGMPTGVQALIDRVNAADALMIGCPEYNYSVSGVLKNAIDWVSRARPMPWRGKSVYLMAASPSPMGGIRGLWQTRIPLEGCGALVFPDMFALAHAATAFDANGRLRDQKLEERLICEVIGFVRLSEAVAPILSHPGSEDARRRQEQIVAALENESALQPT